MGCFVREPIIEPSPDCVPSCPENFDYHFAVQLSNGKWADKVGFTESRYNRIDGTAIKWEINEYQIYDSDTVYFAVGN